MATYIQESNHGSALAKITLGKSDAENNNRIWSKEEYLNTQFLNQYTAVSQQLCNDGFYEGYFTTTDQFSINYLYLKRPNAIATIIFCSGFLPGRKEGLASFFALLPEEYNILFFDARGHGKSSGSLFSSWNQYGIKEYRDVVAAINFAHEQDSAPIILFGICAGAYHASRAILALQEKEILNKFNIRGLIFDSGWGSVTTSSLSAMQAYINDSLIKKCTHLTQSDRHQIKEKRWFRALHATVEATFNYLHKLFIQPRLSEYEQKTTLFSRISRMPIPIFFIHSYDDQYVNINDVKKLSMLAPHSESWWISYPSKHACHHLKYQNEYINRVIRFIHTVIRT